MFVFICSDDRSQGEASFMEESSELDKLTLKEGFKSYCLAAKKHVDKEVLDKILKLCRSKYVSLFWSVLDEQDFDSAPR